MPSVWRLLLNPTPILFFGGKGGVGKTTLAGATALMLAERGKRTLLVSTDPAHSLSDLLDADLGDTPEELRPGLWVRELDPERARAQYLDTVKANIRRFAAPEFLQEAERQVELSGQHPGVAESALFEALCRQLDDLDSWDHLIIDTAPTGHTLHLLTLPEAMHAWTQSLLAHQLHQRAGNLPPSQDPRQQARQVLEARQALFQRTRERLQDDATTGFVLVVNDDRLSVSEGIRAREALAKAKVSIPALLVNRATGDPASLGEAMNRRFPGLSVAVLPAQSPAPQGVEGLALLAKQLQNRSLWQP